MRISRPLVDDVPVDAGERMEVVADYAKILSDSYIRWANAGKEEEIDTSGIWEELNG